MRQPNKQNVADASHTAADLRRAGREAVLVCAVTAAAVAAGITGLWLASDAAIRSSYQQYLVGLALAAASQMDPDLHESIRDPAQINGPDYRRAVEPLKRLVAAVADAKYVYTVVRDGTDIRFVLDAANPGDLDGDGVEDQSGVWELYADADPAMQSVLGDGRAVGLAVATARPDVDEWGAFMTGYAPIVTVDGRQDGAVGGVFDARG
jgi:hypothetical protein